MKRTVQIYGLLFCLMIIQIVPLFSQSLNRTFIYDSNGNTLYFDRIENVIHIGFVTGTDIGTKNKVLEDLSCIADYVMFPDSSYCFVVKQGGRKTENGKRKYRTFAAMKNSKK